MLAAPDIDVGVFKAQIAKLNPAHISVLVSANDRALSLSRHLAGDRPRVGALNPKSPADKAVLDRLGVRVYDVSGEAGGVYGHSMYGDAPDVVKQIGTTIGAKRVQDSDVTAILGTRPIDDKVITKPLPPAPLAPLPPPIAPAPAPPVTAATPLH